MTRRKTDSGSDNKIQTPSRKYPQAPVVGVGAVVIERDQVLLVRRGQEPLLGQWSLPGGAVEVGETLEEAVVREVSEETGISVRPITMLKTFDRIDRDAEGRARFHYVLIDFLCSLQAVALETEPLGATDVFDARWVPLRDLRLSQEFVLPGWTLEVIEQGWQRVQTNGPLTPVF